MLDLGLSPKQARRGSAYLLYFKDGASAEDFLTRIGAPHAAMELMQAKVEKNLRNTINRQVNCETANMMKACRCIGAADRGDSGADRQPGGGRISGQPVGDCAPASGISDGQPVRAGAAVRPAHLQTGTEPPPEKDHRACGKGGLNWYHLHICMSTANTACWTAPAVSNSWWTRVARRWGRPALRAHRPWRHVRRRRLLPRLPRQSGIHPVIGCEVYLAPHSRFDRSYINGEWHTHLILLCENDDRLSQPHPHGVVRSSRRASTMKPAYRHGAAARAQRGSDLSVRVSGALDSACAGRRRYGRRV